MAGWSCYDAETIEWDGTIRVRNNLFVGNNARVSGTTKLDGNVSIGAVEPQPTTSLFIRGSIADVYFTTDGVRQIFTRASTSYIDANTAGGQLSFVVNGNPDASAALFISSTNNIGIGTTSPTGKLHVGGASDTNTYQYISTDSRSWIIGVGYTGGDDNFVISDGSTLNRLRIKTDGNLILNGDGGYVGIGTTNPTQKFHIQTSGASVYQLIENTLAAGSSGVQLQGGDGTIWSLISNYPATGDFDIREAGVADRLIIKKTSGNVGIRTTTPLVTLDVSGAIMARNGATGTFTTADLKTVTVSGGIVISIV